MARKSKAAVIAELENRAAVAEAAISVIEHDREFLKRALAVAKALVENLTAQRDLLQQQVDALGRGLHMEGQ